LAFENDCHPKLRNCQIENGEAAIGGALFFDRSLVDIENCNIVNNTAYQGAGMFTRVADGSIIGTIFANNVAAPTPITLYHDDILGLGGALMLDTSIVDIYDSMFIGNHATASGGAIYTVGNNSYSDNFTTLNNCLFIGGTAGRDGGAISANWYSELSIYNCTIANNNATGTLDGNSIGGGVYCGYDSNTIITNSIIWDNFATLGEQLAIGTSIHPSSMVVSYSDVENGETGVFVDIGNLTNPNDDCKLYWDYNTNMTGTVLSNPKFASGFGRDYYLSAKDTGDSNQVVYSPAIDRGKGDANDVNSLILGKIRYTTRTDNGEDVNSMDLGFHYYKVGQFSIGDLNYDGFVDDMDLIPILMEFWLNRCYFPDWCQGADLNRDGIVNSKDYSTYAQNYGNEDEYPPMPNPLTWSLAPMTINNATTVTMAATSAIDNSAKPVYYYFKCTTDANYDSGWKSEPNYTVSGLKTNTEYGFEVSAADHKLIKNKSYIYDQNYIDAEDKFEFMDEYLDNPDNIYDIFNYSDIERNKVATQWSARAYVVTIAPAVVPATPTDLDAAATATDRIYLSWTNNAADADMVLIERGYNSDNFTPLASLGADANSYTDIGLSGSTTFFYRVRAHSPIGYSNYSNIASATTLGGGEPNDPNDPNVPTDDFLPPTPNPSEWAADPNVVGSGFTASITMTAVTAEDPSGGVQYYFECTTLNGLSSGWIDTPTYEVVVGVSAYGQKFRVRTRDALGNIGNWSTTLAAQ
jgi:predicted outer membrane repeat protein